MPVRGLIPYDLFPLSSMEHELLEEFIAHVCMQFGGKEGRDYQKKVFGPRKDRVEFVVFNQNEFYNSFAVLSAEAKVNFKCLFRSLWEGWEKVDIVDYQYTRDLRVTLIR